MKIVFILALFVQIIFAVSPMEPSRRTLSIFQHGIGAENGHILSDCKAQGKTAIVTFGRANGLTGFMADSVMGSSHLIYNQALDHPGNTPVELKKGFAYRDFDPVASNIQYGGTTKACLDLKAPLVYPDAESDKFFKVDSSFKVPNWSSLESASMRWMAYEMGSFLGWMKNTKKISLKDSLPIKSIRPYQKYDYSLKNYVDGDTLVALEHDSSAYNSPDHDPRLYLWFLNQKLDTLATPQLTSELVIEWLKKLRKDRPDLVPSRYNFLVHSMGGLTSREYIQGAQYQGDVDKLITFDSPHEGAGIADFNYILMSNKWEDRGAEKIKQMLLESIVSGGQYMSFETMGYIFTSAVLMDPLKDLIWSLVARYGNKDFTILDQGNYYLTRQELLGIGEVHDSPIKDLNANLMATSYLFPPTRIFHHEGMPSISNPGDFDGTFNTAGDNGMNALGGPIYMSAFIADQLFKDHGYTDNIPQNQRMLNGILAMTAFPFGISLAKQGTIAVDYASSKGENVEVFKKSNDLQRRLYSIRYDDNDNIFEDEYDRAVAFTKISRGIVGVTTSIAVGSAMYTSCVSLIYNHPFCKNMSLNVMMPIADLSAEQIALGVKDIFKADTVANSHDYATMASWKKHTSGNPDATDLEEFIYEKPFVSLASFEVGDSVQPKILFDTLANSMRRNGPAEFLKFNDICTASDSLCQKSDSLARLKMISMLPKSILPELDFNSSGWQGALGLKYEKYDVITCENKDICKARYSPKENLEDTSTWPKVRRSHRLALNNLVLTNTPAEFHFVVDDVRPDLLQSVVIDFNFSHKFKWTFLSDKSGMCALNYYGQAGDKLLQARTDCPADAWGNWIFRPNELIKQVNTGYNTDNLIVDGQNVLTISVKNKIGLEHTQRLNISRLATPPYLDSRWPLPGIVLNNTAPTTKMEYDLLNYQGLNIDKALGCVLPADSSTCIWNDLTIQGGFLLQNLSGLNSDHAWDIVNKVTSKQGTQAGKSFTMISRVFIDTTAPELNLIATPEEKTGVINPSKNPTVALLKWSDKNRLRTLGAQIYNDQNQKVADLPLKQWFSQREVRLDWNHFDSTLVNGRYNLKVVAIDEAVYDSASNNMATQEYKNVIFNVFKGAKYVTSYAYEDWKKESFVSSIDSTYSVYLSDYNTDVLDSGLSAFRALKGAVNKKEYAEWISFWHLLKENSKVSRFNLAQDSVVFTVRTKLPELSIDSIHTTFNQNTPVRFLVRVKDLHLKQSDTSKINIRFRIHKSGGAELTSLKQVELVGGSLNQGISLDTILPEVAGSELESGDYTIDAEWSDLAGNIKQDTALATFKVDRVAPSMSNVFASGHIFPINETKAKVYFDVTDFESCSVKVYSPTSDYTLPMDSIHNNSGHKYVNLARLQDTGEYKARVICEDSVGNIQEQSTVFLAGVRPSVITSPNLSADQALKNNLVVIKGMVYHPDPLRSEKTEGVTFTLDYKVGNDTTWKSTGIEVMSEYQKNKLRANQGDRVVESEQVLALWDLSKDSTTTTNTLDLRLTVKSCIDTVCISYPVIKTYTFSPSTTPETLKVALEGVPKQITSGQGATFKPMIMSKQSGYKVQNYKVSLQVRDAEQNVLLSQNLNASPTHLWGAPAPDTSKKGISVYYDSLGWHLKYQSNNNLKTPIQYFTENKRDSLLFVNRTDSVNVKSYRIQLGFDQAVGCPALAVANISCSADSTLRAFDVQTQKMFKSSLNLTLNANLDVNDFLIPTQSSGQMTLIALADTISQAHTDSLQAQLPTELVGQKLLALANPMVNMSLVYLGAAATPASEQNYFAVIPLIQGIQIPWNGFTQIANQYPRAGKATVRLVVTGDSSLSMAQVLADTFNIVADSAQIPNLTATPNTLYHSADSNGIGLVLGQIQFKFGLKGQSAKVRALIYKNDTLVKTLLPSTLYKAVQDSLPYSLMWNGQLEGANQSAATGAYELRMYLDTNTNVVANSVPFSVKIGPWVAASTDAESGVGQNLQLAFKESQIKNNQPFVQATGDYLIGAQAKASVFKPDSLFYKVNYIGKQEVVNLPAERFSVLAHARRDKLEMDVVVAIASVTLGHLGGSCKYDGSQGQLEVVYKRKKIVFKKGERYLSDVHTMEVGYTFDEDRHIGYGGGGGGLLPFHFYTIAFDANDALKTGDDFMKELAKLPLDVEVLKEYPKGSELDKIMAEFRKSSHGYSSHFLEGINKGDFGRNVTRNNVSKTYDTVKDSGNGIVVLDTNNYDYNSDLLNVRVSKHSASDDGYSWGDATYYTCDNDNADYAYGAKFEFHIPYSYWTRIIGQNNLVNRALRFDPFNDMLQKTDKNVFPNQARRLVTPYESQSINISNNNVGEWLKFFGPANPIGETTKETIDLKVIGTGTPEHFIQADVLNGTTVLGSDDNDGGSSEIHTVDLNAKGASLNSSNLTLRASLKMKETELKNSYSDSVAFPASATDWIYSSKLPLCLPVELAATTSALRKCVVRYPLASGVRYYSTLPNQTEPEYFKLKFDSTGFLIGNGYEQILTWDSAQTRLNIADIGKASCSRKAYFNNYDAQTRSALLLDTANKWIPQGASGNSCINIGSNVALASRVVEIDAQTSDLAKVYVNNNAYTASMSVGATLSNLTIKRQNSDSDLEAWNPQTDTTYTENMLNQEFPLFHNGGYSSGDPKTLFIKASSLWPQDSLVRKWLPSSTDTIKATWSDAYLKGLESINVSANTKATNSLLLKSGSSFYKNPNLVDLKFYNLKAYDLDQKEHPIFNAKWVKGSAGNVISGAQGVDTLATRDNTGSIVIYRNPQGTTRFSEWVTVLADQTWDSSQVYYNNNHKVVPIYSSYKKYDSLLWREADFLGHSQVRYNNSDWKVIGYLNLSRLNGSTSFYLVKHGTGKTFYKQFDLMVGDYFKSNAQVVNSVFGNASVRLPTGAYGDSAQAITIRTISPKENQIVAQNGLPVVGPVIEILPSHHFCNNTDTCLSENKPIVKVSLLKSELKVDANTYQDPFALTLYKLKDSVVTPLENMTWLFYKSGVACVNGLYTTRIKNAQICDGLWDAVDISASTASFSEFALIDTAHAPARNYTLSASPLISDSLIRKVDFKGSRFAEFYLDDDSLLVDVQDATPATKIMLDSMNKSIDAVSGVVALPKNKTNYLFAIPTDSLGRALPNMMPKVKLTYTPELEFAYTGADTLWFGNVNGSLLVPYTSNNEGVLHTTLRNVYGHSIYEFDTLLKLSDTLKLKAYIDVQKRDTLRMLLAANSSTGQSLQVLGPVVRVDTEKPRLSLNASLETNGYGGIFHYRVTVKDSESGILKTPYKIVLGSKVLDQGDLGVALLDNQLNISRKTLEECLGCELKLYVSTYDRGLNSDSLEWTQNHVYPLPKGLVAWYPMGEGFGDVALDLGPWSKHLKLWLSNLAWSEKEALRLGFAPDSGKSALFETSFAPSGFSDTLWAVDGWFKGLGTSSSTRNLWTWQSIDGKITQIYREGSDLILAQGASHHRLSNAFEGDGLWTHFALSYDHGVLTAYRNAQKFTQLTVGEFNWGSLGFFKLGGSTGIFAKLKDWRFYNHNLDSAEVASLYHYREDHAATWTLVQAENGTLSSGLVTDLSCAVPSKKVVKANFANTLHIPISVTKTGNYGLALQLYGNGTATVQINGKIIGSVNNTNGNIWAKEWVKLASSPSSILLNPGFYTLDISLAQGQRLDFAALSSRSDVNLADLKDSVVNLASAKVISYFKEEFQGAQTANFKLMFKNIGTQNVNGYKLRYYFKEPGVAREGQIWDSNNPASVSFSQDDQGVEYAEVVVNSEIVQPNQNNVSGRGISLALRPINNPEDWQLRWFAKDDPSWILSNNQFVANPGVQILDLNNQPLNNLFCPFDASPIVAPATVQVVAFEARGSSEKSSNPQFRIENVGQTSLVKPEIRYYYTVKESKPWVDMYNMKEGSTWSIKDHGNNNWSLAVKFANDLAPGEKSNYDGFTSVGFSLNDPYNWTQSWLRSDDWSGQDLTQTAQITRKIAVFDASGNKIWGDIPSWANTSPSTDGSISTNGDQIILDLKTAGYVRVRLVTISGQDAGTLFQGNLGVGIQQWTLSASQFSNKSNLKVIVELNNRVIINQNL